MTGKWLWMTLMALGLALGSVGAAHAMDDEDEDGGVETILSIREKLGLSDAQVVKLKSLRTRAVAEIRPLVKRQVADLKILGAKVKAGADDLELKPILHRMEKQHDRITDLREKYWDRGMDVLSPTQQAKVVLGVTMMRLKALKAVGEKIKEKRRGYGD